LGITTPKTRDILRALLSRVWPSWRAYGKMEFWANQSKCLGFEDLMKKPVAVPKEAIDRELEKIKNQAAEMTAKRKKKAPRIS
jgi:hypothetical protein